MGLRFLCRVLAPCLFLLIGTAVEIARPKPAIAAEEIRLLVGGPIILSVSVDSLAAFAETGEVAEDMRLFTRFANEEAIAALRQALQADIPLTVQQVDNLGYSNLGQDILFNVGKVIRPHPSLNGDRDVRSAYFEALNLAFWNVELKGDTTYLPYLSDRYAQQLSASQIPTLTIVRDVPPEIIKNMGSVE